MKKVIIWIVVNSVFSALIYFGLYKQIEGVENVLMFFAWVNIIFSFFTLSDDFVDTLKKKGLNRSVPQCIGITYDVAVAAVFAYYGAIITASFWLIHLLLQEYAFAKIDSEKEKS